jgi:hypothetical protein
VNPLRVIQREVAGAWRSVRYDLRKRGSASAEPAADPWADSWSQTEVELRAPRAVAPPAPKGHRRAKAGRAKPKGPRPGDPVRSPARQRVTLAAAGLVLLALSAGGVLAMISGMRALLDPGAPPAGLPAHAAPAPSHAPSSGPLVPVVTTSGPGYPVAVTKRPPHATTSMPARPPVPTPAPVPTCSCTQPPSPSASASPTPSGTPTASPSGVTSPTATAGTTDPPEPGATR